MAVPTISLPLTTSPLALQMEGTRRGSPQWQEKQSSKGDHPTRPEGSEGGPRKKATPNVRYG